MLLYEKNICDIEREIKMKIYETFSEEENKKNRFLLEQSKAGEIYCLNGDLGVGKTIFTKGFAKGLGIKRRRRYKPYFYYCK